MSQDIANVFAGVFVLQETLNWKNFVSFKRCVLDYAPSRLLSVVTSIMREQDLSPLIASRPNAMMMDIRTYDKAEREYQKHLEA